MHRMAALILMLWGVATSAAEMTDGALRAKAMEFVDSFVESAGLPRGENATVTIELVELNGDAPREAFVIVKGGHWCGSRGCSAVVLDLSGAAAMSVGDFIAAELDALPGTTNGWRDIAVNGTRHVYRDGGYGRS
jgi:hypothetical protein